MMRQKYVQKIAVIANFLTIEEAWNFIPVFGSDFSFAEICSQTFHMYQKFEYAYWFDWILIIDDITIARNTIKDCFGNGWIESGEDEIWNAENRTELSVPIWAILYEPNSCCSVDEARRLNPQPRLEPSQAFFSVSTRGEFTGNYQ